MRAVLATRTSPLDADALDEEVGGQRLAGCGVDQRDRPEAGLGGVLPGDVGRRGARRDQQVDRAERTVHGQGDGACPGPASPDVPLAMSGRVVALHERRHA